MHPQRALRSLIILIVLGTTVGCDQVSKHIVRERIGDNEKISLIKDHLTLTKVENKGAFLSLGNTLPDSLKKILLTFFPVFFLTLLLVYAFTKRTMSTVSLLGICLVVGGGIGNIYDRVVYGSVTDFLHADFVVFQTGIFNIADMAIMGGIFMVITDYYLRRIIVSFHRGDKA